MNSYKNKSNILKNKTSTKSMYRNNKYEKEKNIHKT